jgi:hypothetical protein
MRSLSVFAIVLLVGTAVVLIGCGGSSSNSNTSLTQAQAQQLAGEAYTLAANALMSAAVTGAATEQFTSVTTRLEALRKRDLAAAPSPKSVACISSGTSCSLSGTYNCPSGGSVTVSGNLTESNNNSFSATIPRRRPAARMAPSSSTVIRV